MLQEVVAEWHEDWGDHLPALPSAYYSTTHSSNGLSPYGMFYGRGVEHAHQIGPDDGEPSEHRVLGKQTSGSVMPEPVVEPVYDSATEDVVSLSELDSEDCVSSHVEDE